MPQLPAGLSGIWLTQLCFEQRRQAPLLRPQHAQLRIEGPGSWGQPFYASVTLLQPQAAGTVWTAWHADCLSWIIR